MQKNVITKTLLASSLSLALTTAYAAPYDIVDLGNLGGTQSAASSINDASEIVGSANGPLNTDTNNPSFDSHAVKFVMGANEDLGVVNGSSSSALNINNNGAVVGFSSDVVEVTDSTGNVIEVPTFVAASFTTGEAQKFTNLGDLLSTRAYKVNDSGVVLATGNIDLDPDDAVGLVGRPFVYNLSSQQVMQILVPFVDNVQEFFATGINNNGMIVGWIRHIDENNANFIQSFQTNVSDLTTLTPLQQDENSFHFALNVNDNGMIVGRTALTDGSQSGFILDSNTNEYTSIGFLGAGFTFSTANAINEQNQVVGRALNSNPLNNISAAVLYEDAQLKNLNDLVTCNSGWNLIEATDINNSGEIVGYGLISNEVRAFKLVPTGGAVEDCNPEPQPSTSSGGSWSVFGLALLALFGFRRKFS